MKSEKLLDSDYYKQYEYVFFYFISSCNLYYINKIVFATCFRRCDYIFNWYFSREISFPARNQRGDDLLLFLGIIDILQNYRLLKKLEHTWKSMLHDGVRISVKIV